MYVCICNAITDRDVDGAIERGCRSPKAIYAACGHEARCGQCAETMRERLDAHECAAKAQIKFAAE